MRDNKDAVLDMLFAAFEKHQYYNIKDLVKITKQPIVSRLYQKSFSRPRRLNTKKCNHFTGLLEGDSVRGLQLQPEKSSQEHVGTETGIPPLQGPRQGWRRQIFVEEPEGTVNFFN